jgi:tRNA(Ile)-lysidine synthase
MIEKVLSTIGKHKLIEPGQLILVGISGGPDSVCLLHVLHSLAERLQIKLHAVHVNHMLRGDEAEADRAYVEDLCLRLHIPLNTVAANIRELAADRGLSLEEAGREARYEAFERLAQRLGAARIAVAHNRNDQAETLLMRLIRGTGLEGLKGMEVLRGNIIRPLLEIDRSEIELYCDVKRLQPRIDRSNLECVYTRNKIRLQLIPTINSLFGTDVVESLNKLACIVKDENEYLEEQAMLLFKNSMAGQKTGSISLRLELLQGYHPALQKRILRYAVKKLRGHLKEIENVHVESLLELMNGRTGAEVHLPGGMRAKKSYHELKFTLQQEETPGPFETSLVIPGTTIVGDAGAEFHSSTANTAKDIEQYTNMRYNANIQYFDLEKLGSSVWVRNRRNGDVFRPLKSNGTRKLKEFLIDSKVPREERDGIPLVAVGHEIVWIVGFKISDKFKVTDHTKTILKLEFQPFAAQKAGIEV